MWDENISLQLPFTKQLLIEVNNADVKGTINRIAFVLAHRSLQRQSALSAFHEYIMTGFEKVTVGQFDNTHILSDLDVRTIVDAQKLAEFEFPSDSKG